MPSVIAPAPLPYSKRDKSATFRLENMGRYNSKVTRTARTEGQGGEITDRRNDESVLAVTSLFHALQFHVKPLPELDHISADGLVTRPFVFDV